MIREERKSGVEVTRLEHLSKALKEHADNAQLV